MSESEKEKFEQTARQFPELDEAGRRRAMARAATGVDAHAALAHEAVMSQMVRAYNRPFER